jgi:hypothetical protein
VQSRAWFAAVHETGLGRFYTILAVETAFKKWEAMQNIGR